MPDPFAQQTIPSAAPRYHQGRKMFGGRYTLLKPLGRGGMGEVWLAQDNELGVQRALKFAPPEVAADARSVAMLKREAIAGTSLAHPNIVRIFDFAHDAAAMESAVVMEVVEGKSLSEIQAKRIEESGNGFFEPEEIEKWLRDACAALDYAHGEGRVHRDLKPQNLMIETATGRLKIMDFGISRRIGDSFSQLTGKDSSGTLPYMSPQQVMGEPPGTSDDIYGLGATLYDLLSGSPPFIGGALEAQVREKAPPAIAARRAEVNASVGKPVPQAWESAVMICLAKSREKRPANAAAVREAIQSAPPSPLSGPLAADAETRKRAALDEKRREEERQMAEERKRARAAVEEPPPLQEARAAATSPAGEVYAELFSPDASGYSPLRLAYLPVSPRGAWMDRRHEADQIARRLSPLVQGIPAVSSSVAAFAMARRHQVNHGMMVCCEVRPDHVCCSWLEIEHGVYQEFATWSIDSTGLAADRLAARVQASLEAMRTHTHRDPARIQGWGVTHSGSATRALARDLSEKLPGTAWLWKEDLPAALAGAQAGPQLSDVLLLRVVPYALSVRLPDQSLLPLMQRFSTLPAGRSLDLSWPGDRDLSSTRIEIVEETDRGVVPVKSQAMARSLCRVQNNRVQTTLRLDIDAGWQVSLTLDPPPGAEKPGPSASRAASGPSANVPSSPAAAPAAPASAPDSGSNYKRRGFFIGDGTSASAPDSGSNHDGIATILTAILIVGTFIAALVLRPDWDNVAYWRNGTIILLLLQLCACGAEKDSDEISKRLLGPVVVTLLAAILFAITAWIWPRKVVTETDAAARRFSENKVFTAPDVPKGEAAPSPLPSAGLDEPKAPSRLEDIK